MAEKERGFRPPRSAERNQSDLDLSNLDLSLESHFNADKERKKTLLENQIETIVHRWLLSYKFFREAHKLFSNKERLKEAAHTFRRADGILRQLLPYLREDPRVPSIRVEFIERKTWVNLKATDFLRLPREQGLLSWIADWLSEIKPQPGRPPNVVLANCAEELATVFKERTGQNRWEKVGRLVAKGFAQYLPPDKELRDHRLWILKLVKRNQKRKQRIREFNSKSKANLKKGSSPKY
jgi:hypothetical protein